MSKHLRRDLDALERRILAMSSMVEAMIEKACRGFMERQAALAEEVLLLEPKIDCEEVLIEEECLKILALHQPVAGDLRQVAAVLKINNELERIADLTVNLGEWTMSLTEHPGCPLPPELPRMAELAGGMVRRALDAFVQQDVQAARALVADDDEVDQLNAEIFVKLEAAMRQQPQQVAAAMHYFSAARHVERMADHATNIAEDVIYLVEGEIARHRAAVAATAPAQPTRQSPRPR